MIERTDISQILTQMRAVQAQMQQGRMDIGAAGLISPASLARPEQKNSFGELFSNAINTVNEVQQKSSALSKAYESGDASVSLTEVMVAAEKSGVAFSAMTQVRNRLVDAYKEIMSMPI